MAPVIILWKIRISGGIFYNKDFYMKKYVVDDIKENFLGNAVLLKRGRGFVYRQVFPLYFTDGMRRGDVVCGLGAKDFIIPTAWVYRGRLDLTIEPVSEYRIKNFISDRFGFCDGIYFRYALARALWGRGITPTMNSTNNLRLFLHSNKTR